MFGTRAVAVALGVVALTAASVPAAYAGARGCNNRTCIEVDGSGLHVNYVAASSTWGGDFTGHYHIYGGGLNYNSFDGFWGYHQVYRIDVGRDLPNGAVLCAEGWEKRAGGGYNLVGRPCEEVHF